MINKIDTPILFNNIAYRYDFLNHFLSFGLDKHWRKLFIKSLPDKNYSKLVDLACGTGDLTLELNKKFPDSKIIGLDPAEKMLNIAIQKNPGLRFINAKAENIPLASNTFELVATAFGIRNFKCPKKAISEVYRILKPNGTFAIMELDIPKKNIISSPYIFYFDNLMPFLGEHLSGDKTAYSYLKKSVKEFNKSFNLSDSLLNQGFSIQSNKKISMGVINIIIAKKDTL